jgi:hypothetical protein
LNQSIFFSSKKTSGIDFLLQGDATPRLRCRHMFLAIAMLYNEGVKVQG